ncbi:MAG: hypothetical protein HY683_00430 [Chloroflexi bacterium]|nr:hypothetical protein [Chloroflexota bacterium]
MIYVECKPDEILVRTLTGLSRRQVIHESKGKPAVAKEMRSRTGVLGMVDEDPGSVQPAYFTEMVVQRELSKQHLKLLRDTQTNNRLVLLCPYFEAWIVYAAHTAKIDITKYGLPANPVSLHQIINADPRKFERLVEHLQPTDPLKALKRLLAP